MKIKKIVLSILLVFLMIGMLGVLAIPQLSYLTRNHGYNRDNIIGLYAERSNSLDMVYIGGSACFVYWEALRAWNNYGITSYDFASDTITPEAEKYFIKEVLKTQNPELFVVDLRPFQYGAVAYSDTVSTPNMYFETPIRNGTDGFLYSDNRNDLIKTSVKNPIERIPYYYDFLKYHSNLLGRTFDTIYGYTKGDTGQIDYLNNVKKNNLKGFYFVEKTKPVIFEDFSNDTNIRKLDNMVEPYFIDLLEYCKSEKLNVLFIVHSYAQQKEHKEMYNYMKEKIQEYGFDFLNTNDYWSEIGLDYGFDLYNENHVNVFGAEKYTDFVGNYIIEHYELPNHHGDEEYSDWDNLYKEFEVCTNDAKTAIRNYKPDE